ncbi:MAG: DUF72 domain-containing protein [Nitrospirae bacterium]|nr:DUF72 domain-containing protein [Nitrospirota bacterium]
MGQVFIGTSGWTYPDWRGIFYPGDLPSRQYLEFYAREFCTTEVNYSFYHLPKPETYAKWAGQVPDGFLFAVKASRFITHTKRLHAVTGAWRTFIRNALALRPHIGPILLQFPPNFVCNRKRLAAFLEKARDAASGDRPLRLVFEFRHESWFTEEIYRLLKRHHAALCIADSPGYPRRDVLTADFVYLRFHGREQLFVSSYSRDELAVEAKTIRRYKRDGLDVFVYFNNTDGGHAIKNARTLKLLMERSSE